MWLLFFFFFKQKTAYEMRISDWSSDVCSSDLHDTAHADIHRISMKMGEHPGNTGAGHLRCRGGGSNRRRNAIKDEERRRQEPSSYAEHARKHAHNAAKANNDKGIDRQIGDGKVKVHYSGPGTALGLTAIRSE